MENNHIKGDNSVIDVSSYIINYCHSNSISITNLKLQKLLYFCEASYLIETKEKSACFDDEILAWPYGPVVKRIYNLYSNFKNAEITVKPKLTSKIKNENIIEITLEVLSPYNAYVLAEMTHSHWPWIRAYKMGSNTIITKASIYDYVTNSHNNGINKR